MKIPLFLLLGVSLFGTEMLERTQVLMGTYATITVPQEKRKEQQKAFEILYAVEHSLSSYDPNADIYKLNHNRTVSLSPYSYEALLLSKRYYKESDGYFDITVGSITRGLFHFGEAERLPERQELQKAKIDFKGLHFNAERAEVEKGVTIDLGGMGKGFGVDKAEAYLSEQNITEGRIALSGDIRCLGTCKVAIQDPFSEGTIASFTTRHPNMAISTSGNYRRYVESKSNSHLIDPKKRMSETAFASITLLSRGSNSDIDAYATAASVMPVTKALRFLEMLDVAYLLVSTDGERYKSSNFEQFASRFIYLK